MRGDGREKEVANLNFETGEGRVSAAPLVSLSHSVLERSRVGCLGEKTAAFEEEEGSRLTDPPKKGSRTWADAGEKGD